MVGKRGGRREGHEKKGLHVSNREWMYANKSEGT